MSEADIAHHDRSQPPSQPYFSTVVSNLTRSPLSVVVTVIIALGIGFLAVKLIDWAIFNAVFRADDIDKCGTIDGACWSVIALRYRIILFGLYPYDQQWRSALGCLIAVVTVASSCMPSMWSARRMLAIWIAGTGLFLLIVRGGYFGLPLVPPGNWGGLTLTLFIYIAVVAIGMPTAILLALIRAGKYPAFRWLSGLIADVTRSLPLVCILFASIVILPYLVPERVMGDRVFRVILGFAFFFGCCQSEILRGALVSLPPGQDEAGRALGLSYRHRINLIVLPQIFKVSMPLTINQLVVTFKETSLVAIVGLFDLMTSANAAYNTSDFNFYYREVYAFTALVYFVFVFVLSRYGRYLEKRAGY